jgi:hypothetical protein
VEEDKVVDKVVVKEDKDRDKVEGAVGKEVVVRVVEEDRVVEGVRDSDREENVDAHHAANRFHTSREFPVIKQNVLNVVPQCQENNKGVH